MFGSYMANYHRFAVGEIFSAFNSSRSFNLDEWSVLRQNQGKIIC